MLPSPYCSSVIEGDERFACRDMVQLIPAMVNAVGPTLNRFSYTSSVDRQGQSSPSLDASHKSTYSRGFVGMSRVQSMP